MALKIDIRKAFDTIRWDFLLAVLRQFGFSEVFVQRIAVVLSSARLSILVNGSPHGFFSCSRGVRQGDPISPLLFCLSEEVLSRLITYRVQLRELTLIRAARPLPLTLCGRRPVILSSYVQ